MNQTFTLDSYRTFICSVYSMSPHLPQFQNPPGATPPPSPQVRTLDREFEEDLPVLPVPVLQGVRPVQVAKHVLPYQGPAVDIYQSVSNIYQSGGNVLYRDTVLGIHGILMRIRIRGSVPLTNGSSSRSIQLRIRLLFSVSSRMQNKIFFIFFSYNLTAGILSSVLKTLFFAKILFQI